jgi:hypothetical protein
MADEPSPPAGPDLTLGIDLSEFTGETLLGHDVFASALKPASAAF